MFSTRFCGDRDLPYWLSYRLGSILYRRLPPHGELMGDRVSSRHSANFLHSFSPSEPKKSAKFKFTV